MLGFSGFILWIALGVAATMAFAEFGLRPTRREIERGRH